MADKPFISVRKSIKWGSSPAFENTSTLVLTSAGKYFVDIRIYKSPPNNHSNPKDAITSEQPEQLEWAFAGTSSHTPAEPEEGKPAHTIWTHWVDSKAPIGKEVRDEGDMYEIGNGEVLERGEMRNPDSGVLEAYEECWVDLGVGRVGGEEGRRSWVLRTCEWGEGDGSGEGTRGLIVRVGEWIQGVLRRGESVSVVRWVWSAEEGWRKVAAIGELDVPSEVRGVVEVSLRNRFVGIDGLRWECVERYSWS